jgi:hypothetical protein
MPSGKTLTCGLFGDEWPGVEVRCGYGADDLMRSHRVRTVDDARSVAETWRLAVLTKIQR